MKLRDNLRPKLRHGARLLGPAGAWGLVPTWYLTPGLAEGHVKLMVFLLISGLNSYRDFSLQISASGLGEAWRQWEEDPELCCRDWFLYEGPSKGEALPPLPTPAGVGSVDDLF